MNIKILINDLIITFFGVGKIPIATGTFGSLAAIPLCMLLLNIHHNLIFAVIIFFTFIGIISSDIHQRRSGIKDDRIIVIDEVTGQLLAMSFAKNDLILIFFSFMFFRVFDIIKPWPASFADKNIKGGLGVMLDDIFAGIYALLIVLFLREFI